ncbi:hypothetical protein [Phenylobacterium montanum]|uniref:Uncharacterized protein n=1 Tax=Phenylobacterium montanum TaxID=2823693 RepID=A0A975G3R9_9CAUL|nr:hypothetical protein [Caulobacter sp. S6]QUD90009.1 hypothetical protein KCG34_09160 [Caulobacter sp. S6]
MALVVCSVGGGAQAQIGGSLRQGLTTALGRAGNAVLATQKQDGGTGVKQVSTAKPSRKLARRQAASDAGVSTYAVPAEKGSAAAAPAAPARPEECASYVLKVVTDPSQSVCSRK